MLGLEGHVLAVAVVEGLELGAGGQCPALGPLRRFYAKGGPERFPQLYVSLRS